MQSISRARRITWSVAAARLRPSLGPHQHTCAGDALDADLHGMPFSSLPMHRTFSSYLPGAACGNLLHLKSRFEQERQNYMYRTCTSCFSTDSSENNSSPTESVQELYQKMLKSVQTRTMPPNALMWSMIKGCSNEEDIKLLFEILQKLRVFRLSNLRIHANFNSHLCMRVSEACARAGALDYGLKALWKHNVYGLTPSVGSAHYLLLHAKQHDDIKLMGQIMRVLEKNGLPLQPGTADVVFSMCYSADRWDLLSRYARRFVKAGVKLHRAAFDIWMEFAAKVGDTQSIWEINSLRGRCVKRYTLATGFACAKGFLLEHKPECAAAIIRLLYKHTPDQKKPQVKDELEKLINEWPLEVVKQQKKEARKAVEEALKTDIGNMVTSIINMGFELSTSLKEHGHQVV